jgi:hypothetical protein
VKPNACLTLIFLSGTLGIFAAEQISQTNTTNTTYTVDQITQMDPETKAMVEAWPRGLPTNGLCSALQMIRDGGGDGTQPKCCVNVVNTTSNFYRSLLYLPREVLCQISLIDAEGKRVQEMSSGKQSAPWSQKQIEVWFEKNVERTTGKKPVFQI